MLHQLATILLGPLLLAQGRSVRRTVTKLPEAAGPRAGTAGEGADLRLLVVGDSAGAGVGAATQQEALSGRIVAQLASSFSIPTAGDATRSRPAPSSPSATARANASANPWPASKWR